MRNATQQDDVIDLFVIGGGINGCGIARDAAGRGLRVTLAEMNDLASATSSASTKLFHGGLRYLEYFEFRLVREALIEREVLLRAMPHISWPMRFVLPVSREMRFETETPTGRLLSRIMPWMKGRRPGWLIRLGLFMYDHLGGREILPGTRRVKLGGSAEGLPLKDKFQKAWEYSDCWVQDARLVVLNARDAADRGARIMTRTRVISARREGEEWAVETSDGTIHRARCLVNAGGPWVSDVINDVANINSREGIRLVRGSHIVTRKLYDHDKCYFFQGADGRIIFAIPYEQNFTLIGTTDADHENVDTAPVCTDAERDYLLRFASENFATPVTAEDVVWTYSGVRPLYDDGASSATAATREYVLSLDDNGPPMLNVFGGKITTYRKLAEAALVKLARFFPEAAGPWTAGSTLAGGDFPVDGVAALERQVRDRYGFLAPSDVTRLVRCYGTEVFEMFGAAASPVDLGADFGAGLTGVEVDWLMDKEWAQTADDVLWRRTKLGLRIDAGGVARLSAYMEERLGRS